MNEAASDKVAAARQFAAIRTVLLVSANLELRDLLRQELVALRWQVRVATGGAEAMSQLEETRAEAMLLDTWLPDLEVHELARQLRLLYPAMDLVRVDGSLEGGGARSPRRNELLHALRTAQEAVESGAGRGRQPVRPVGAIGGVIRAAEDRRGAVGQPVQEALTDQMLTEQMLAGHVMIGGAPGGGATAPGDGMPERARRQFTSGERQNDAIFIPGLVGRTEPMRELAELIRMVAPSSAAVLIEGETGSGKEVVAKAIHRLSARSGKSFTVLNCAAIPEALLEAELFGHSRGAFTGADKARTGRIESADGGTLFLDEIGEMPLGMQAKMLRFLDCGELQRVGDNELTRVDVRVLAATHQPLQERAEQHLFRMDLYHRLAVFPIEVPALRERMEDIPLLVDFLLEQKGQGQPRKRISEDALERLQQHRWPGNVRELMHVLERAVIMAGERPEIGPRDIRIRLSQRRRIG